MLFDSRDWQEPQQHFTAALGLHQLTVRDRSADSHAAANTKRVANSNITHLQYDVPVESWGAPERSYLLLAVTEGHMRLQLDTDELDLTAGQGAIILPDSPFRLTNVGRAAGLLWKVSRPALDR